MLLTEERLIVATLTQILTQAPNRSAIYQTLLALDESERAKSRLSSQVIHANGLDLKEQEAVSYQLWVALEDLLQTATMGLTKTQ